jgi:hypothetical protein
MNSRLKLNWCVCGLAVAGAVSMGQHAGATDYYRVVVQNDLQRSASIAEVEVIGTSAPEVSDRDRRGNWRLNWYHSMIAIDGMEQSMDGFDGETWWTKSSSIVDCNGNGIDDAVEIANGAADADGDGRLDSCEFALGDLNLNGVIDQGDVLILLGWWHFPVGAPCDFNADGNIDGRDLGFILARFGWVVN